MGKQLTDCAICSSDYYWMFGGNGYDFSRDRLTHSHDFCQFMAEQVMSVGTNVVVIDNVNYKKEHYEHYLKLAEKYGYGVKIRVIGNTKDCELYAERNLHGVPLENIQRMADNFEL